MIWFVLAALGVPLWICALALFLLLRGRSKVKHIPAGFACKARLISGQAHGLKPEFPRVSNVGHWIHDVLVLHGGDPFLSRTSMHGMTALESGPADVAEGVVKGLADPVGVRFRHDSGAVVEIVCARADMGLTLWPFAAASRD